MAIQKSYKRKFQYLVIGSVIFLFICHKLAFVNTIDEYHLYKENIEQLSLLDEAPVQIRIIDNKLAEIEKSIGDLNDKTTNPQSILLDVANKLISKNGIVINELPRNNSVVLNGFQVTSQQIVFQGPFIGLLKLLHELEKEKGIGNICSVVFYNQKEMKSQSVHLKMKVFIQHIKSVQ